jgi:hypothetical protein
MVRVKDDEDGIEQGDISVFRETTPLEKMRNRNWLRGSFSSLLHGCGTYGPVSNGLDGKTRWIRHKHKKRRVE